MTTNCLEKRLKFCYIYVSYIHISHDSLTFQGQSALQFKKVTFDQKSEPHCFLFLFKFKKCRIATGIETKCYLLT